MYKRSIHLDELLKERSTFLFGARQTGKTTLLQQQLKDAVFYGLNEADTFRDLTSRPELIRLQHPPRNKCIVIDEVQRLPELLNEVHVMIERDPKLRFVLTGSSARSLRRGGVNLLGGRARVAHLFPLVSQELGFRHLDRRLQFGSMPAIFDSKSPERDLKAYVGTYLQEEIRAEGAVRSLESFSRLLDVAALSNGQIINFTSVGSDAGVPPRTVREHFQLLQDTLIGTMLEPFQKTKKRKPIATAKFFLFDVGVANYLTHRLGIQRGSPEYGNAFEHQIFLELRAYLSYRSIDKPLTFWRSQSQHEVDFMIGDDVAIEVKSTERVHERMFGGIKALAEEIRLRRKIIVSFEKRFFQTDDGFEIMPAVYFLKALWNGEIV